MKKLYKYLKLFPIILLGCNWSASAQVTTFASTGVLQTYTVPAGITTLYITALGADGGLDYLGTGPNIGGSGAMVTCQLAVVGGEVLNIYVGGQGKTPLTAFAGAVGGYNGGGNGTGDGGGGGGGTDIRVGGIGIANRVIVAGGGGGAGLDCGAVIGAGSENGGGGGGLTGGDGFDGGTNEAFSGGAQSFGFAPFTGGPGNLFYGTGGIGGGGGGYYGGQAGIDVLGPSQCTTGGGGGGGGSSYTDPGTVSNVFHARSGNALSYPADGQLSICIPGVAGTISGAPICVGGNPVAFSDIGGTPGGTWASSNLLFATVGPTTGIVTPVGFGLDTIFYYASTPCGSDTAMFIFTVSQAADTIRFTGSDTMCQGNSITLSDTSSGGTWSSAPVTIASVGTAGVVSGVSPGSATISYTIPGGCYSTASVVVTAPLPAITGPANGCVGSSITLSDAAIGGTWLSTITSVATIDPFTGDVTVVSTGGDQFIYSYGGCTTVPFFVAFNDTSGDAITGTNTICQGDATSLSEFSISGTWSSTQPAIATVNPLGDVIGISGGKDTIDYNIPGCPSLIFPMLINPLPLPITGMTSICISIATMVSDPTGGGTWSSSDTTVAKISPTGVITDESFVIGSTATITYTLPTACYVTFPVIVNAGPGPILGPDSVCQGATTTLSDAAAGGTWTSTVLAIAQVVDSSGVVSGISGGTVTISYTFANGCFTTTPFIVKPPTPAFVTVTKNPATDSICAGYPVIYTAKPVNAGTNPTYQWVKFYTRIPLAGDTTGFVDTPIHGDVIIVKMAVGSGVCATTDTVADTVTMDVYPNVMPIVTISKLASPDTIDYLGQIITFYSDVVYGGTGPLYQWYYNGSLIPGATNSSYAATVYSTGSYFCVVTGNSRCDSTIVVDTSNVITIYNALYLGTNSLTGVHNSLSLFPNPNNGSLTLSGKVTGNSDISIEVSDMLGHIVYHSSVTPQNGSLSTQVTLDNSIPDGSYLLHVNSGTDNQVFHFVISR